MCETHAADTASAPIPVQETSCCGNDCCGGADASTQQSGTPDVTQAVGRHYSAIASDILSGVCTSCCGDDCCNASSSSISRSLYEVDEHDGVPLKAALASLGCGNPTALAELHPGEVVLDLGSGGGIDV